MATMSLCSEAELQGMSGKLVPSLMATVAAMVAMAFMCTSSDVTRTQLMAPGSHETMVTLSA